MFTKQMLAKHKEKHKCINDSGARFHNHCKTQGIHRFTMLMLPKPYEKQYMNERSFGASLESLPNTRNSYVYQEHINKATGKTINKLMLVGCVAAIIAKHKECTCLLRKRQPNHGKNNK